MQSLTILRPDDWHVHLRDGDVLKDTVAATALHFARALVMPNLQTPLVSLAALRAYQQRIKAHIVKPQSLETYLTFYLNTATDPDDLAVAQGQADILGAKLYPAGATTHSAAGVVDIKTLYPQFEMMQQLDLVLQIHGEVTDGDIFTREARFITSVLKNIIKNFPKLRIVLEHISSRAAVDFIQDTPQHIAATITPQHLLFNRNHLLVAGIKPHYYCLPILKQERDQIALCQAAISGNPKFFAGTDSAPHARRDKESACGCAGVFSAPFAVAMYTEIFEKYDALAQLNGFLSEFGARFYQLPLQTKTLTLRKIPQTIPSSLPFGHKTVIPLAAGSILHWSVDE